MENFKSANLVGHPVKFGSHPTTHYFHDGGKLKELLVRFSKGDFLTLPSVDRKRNKTYLRTLSAELLKRNKLSMAKSILLKALSLGDERNYSYRQLSNIMNRLEMYGDAAFYAQKATIAKDNTDNSRKDHTIHLANMLRLNGDLDQALCTIDAFLEVTPDWFAAYITKANILLARKATEEAKPVILKAMEFGEERNYSCRQLSNILNRLKMNEEAVVYARKAALAQDNTDNSRKDNIEHLANMERLNGDLDTALCTIDALIQEAPGRFSAYTTKANILLGSQAGESAKSAFLKAIELGDERNYTYRQLSNLLYRSKVFGEAVVYARKAALAQDNTDNSRKDNIEHLANMERLNGDLDTALCTIDALIQEAPGRFSAYTTKANILLGSQARESAKSAFLKAIELGDERNYTYRQLSNLLHRQKVFDEALVYARKAALAQDNTESSRKDNTMHLERMIQLNGP
jgi:predicted Zn-dependent protease